MNNVYAIVRVDTFQAPSSWPLTADEWRNLVNVKEIVGDLPEAELEVRRLNDLNSSKGCVYFWLATRYGGALLHAKDGTDPEGFKNQ